MAYALGILEPLSIMFSISDNGIDGKEVTMSKLKEDINELRDSRRRYGREVEK